MSTKTSKNKKLKKSNNKNKVKISKSNSVLYFICILIIATIISMIMHMILLHSGLFYNMNVLFYRGIMLLFVVIIIIALLLYYMSKRFLEISIKDIICILIVIFSINITFFTLVPVTIDRSVTCFTLGKFDVKEDKTLTKTEMEKIFIDTYVYENGAFDKRFEEQVTTGSIEKVSDDTYRLTKRGETLINLFHFVAKLYNVSLKNMSK